MNEFVRNCPKCGKEIFHKNKNAYQVALQRNGKCFTCRRIKHESLIRNCPSCNKEIKHPNMSALRSAKSKNGNCRECTNKIRSINWRTGNCVRCGNEVLYKTLRSKKSAEKSGRPCDKCAEEIKITPLTRICYRCNNEIIYNSRAAYKRAIRLNTGCLNCRPTANNILDNRTSNSRGWSGRYLEGYKFRSILELKYIVDVLLKENHKWESAETNEFMITYYDAEDKKRNYYPDFFVDGKYVVEIKQKNDQNKDIVERKKRAAEEWCIDRGYEYVMLDPGRISAGRLLKMYKSGDLKFNNHSEEKFLEYLNRNNLEINQIYE